MAVLGFGLVLKTSLSVILILIGTDMVLSLPEDSDDRFLKLRGGLRLKLRRKLPIELSERFLSNMVYILGIIVSAAG